MRRLNRFWRDGRGASAVEFALVLPVFLALTLGGMNLCLVTYLNTQLHYAVDDAARCEAVKTTVCTSPTTTQTHAGTTFHFPSTSPVFTATQTTCGGGQAGYQVVGTATYRLNAVVRTVNFSLSAKSCFPIQD